MTTDIERHETTTGEALVPVDIPARWQSLMRLTARVANASMVPKPLRGRPDDVLSLMIYADELGVGPMAALRGIHVIEGQPSCSAALMRALILRSGHKLEWRKVSRTEVVLYGARRDGSSSAEVTWTLEDARAAGLAGKDVWKKYPRAMLAARATSEMARLVFADEIHGMYTPEELGVDSLVGAIDVTTTPYDDGILDEPDEADWADAHDSGPTAQEAGEAELVDRVANADTLWVAAARGDES